MTAVSSETELRHLHATEPTYVETDFRDALGRFASGIVVVTALVDGEPVGFTCQSFSSLSLLPPLVLFCPSRESVTWQQIRTTDSFTINVLAENQQALSNRMAQRRDDKFDGVAWEPGVTGAPRIENSLVHIDCTLHEILEGGDHNIVIGRVEGTAIRTVSRPLLYFRGGYEALGW